jgi:hypothetical protein
MGNTHTFGQWLEDRIHAATEADHERRYRLQLSPPQTSEEAMKLEEFNQSLNQEKQHESN